MLRFYDFNPNPCTTYEMSSSSSPCSVKIIPIDEQLIPSEQHVAKFRHVKVAVVGDTSVGKSSLLDVLTKGPDSYGTVVAKTAGMRVLRNYTVLPEDGDEENNVKMTFFDMKEAFNFMGGNFQCMPVDRTFLDSDTVFLVVIFLPSSRYSGFAQIRTSKWLEKIAAIAPDANVFFALSKCDEYEEDMSDCLCELKCIGRLHLHLDSVFYTSAKTNVGINIIPKSICRVMKNSIDREYNKSFVRVAEWIRSLPDDKLFANSYILHETIMDELKSLHINVDKQQMDCLLQFLWQSGIAYYFPKNPSIAHILFLRPEMISNFAHTLLGFSPKIAIENNGVIQEALLYDFLQHHKLEHQGPHLAALEEIGFITRTMHSNTTTTTGYILPFLLGGYLCNPRLQGEVELCRKRPQAVAKFNNITELLTIVPIGYIQKYLQAWMSRKWRSGDTIVSILSENVIEWRGVLGNGLICIERSRVAVFTAKVSLQIPRSEFANIICCKVVDGINKKIVGLVAMQSKNCPTCEEKEIEPPGVWDYSFLEHLQKICTKVSCPLCKIEMDVDDILRHWKADISDILLDI